MSFHNVLFRPSALHRWDCHHLQRADGTSYSCDIWSSNLICINLLYIFAYNQRTGFDNLWLDVYLLNCSCYSCLFVDGGHSPDFWHSCAIVFVFLMGKFECREFSLQLLEDVLSYRLVLHALYKRGKVNLQNQRASSTLPI